VKATVDDDNFEDDNNFEDVEYLSVNFDMMIWWKKVNIELVILF
jgi:hypothetical protein